jgi:phage-related protein
MLIMISGNPKIVSVVFYRNEGGSEPVREFLLGLEKADRTAIGTDIKTVEYGWPLGMPLVRAMTNYDRLWEVRIKLSGRRIARVLFTVHKDRMVLLHGFIKKTQTTPQQDLKLADKRRKDVERGSFDG